MSADSLDKLTIDRTRPSGKPAWRRRRSALWLVLLLAVALVAAFFARNRPVPIETASVVQVFPTRAFTVLNVSGYVVAQRKAAVASKITGRLEWLGVEEGSRINGGQVIARLENRDLAASVQQGEAAVQSAVAALKQAKAEQEEAALAFGRQRELLGQGVVAQADFDAAAARHKRLDAALDGARAGLKSAREALNASRIIYDYSLIRAPFDAVVLTKNADVGDIITPLGAAANAKAAVFTIADMGSLQVEADVAEANLGQIMNGQFCDISLDALPDAHFRGVINTIVPTADRSKASVMVKIRFLERDSRILPEMGAKVALLERKPRPDEQRPRIAVNPAAIVNIKGREGVFRLTGDTVSFSPITRGERLGDMVEISGAKPGEKIALKPLDRLRDGSKVKLAEKK